MTPKNENNRINNRTARRKIRGFMLLCVCACLCCAGSFSACSLGGGVAVLTVSDSEVTMYIADSLLLTVTSQNAEAVVTWRSENPNIAMVNNGMVTARAVGQTNIFAETEGGSAACKVTVLDRTVTISAESAIIDMAESRTLTLTAASSDGKDVAWSSSDSSVVTVTDGVVTGVDLGSAIVTAQRGLAKAVCAITVVDSSLPSDYYKLRSMINAGCIENSGEWFYFADGSEGIDYSFSSPPVHSDNALSVSFSRLSIDKQKYFSFRTQPTYAVGSAYTASFSVTVNADCKIVYGTTAASGGYVSAELTAGQKTSLEYVGTVDGFVPFSVRVDSLEVPHDETVTLEVEDILFEQGENNYNLTWSTNADAVANPDRWFYLADGASGTDYILSGAPAFRNGTITFGFTKTTEKATYQLRYQPPYEIGTKYEITFTVSVSAAATIVYGSDGEGNRYSNFTAVPSVSQTITYSGVVNGLRPFAVQMSAADVLSPIELTVSDIMLKTL